MKKILMLSAIVAVAISACKSTENTTNQDQESMTTKSTPSAPFDSTIVEKYWKLSTLYGQPVTMSDEQEREAHFILKGDGRINGYAGCNTMNGDYQLEEGYRIGFSNIAITKRMCPEADTEQKFLEALNTADNFSHYGDTLTLNKARVAPLAVFEAVYFD